MGHVYNTPILIIIISSSAKCTYNLVGTSVLAYLIIGKSLCHEAQRTTKNNVKHWKCIGKTNNENNVKYLMIAFGRWYMGGEREKGHGGTTHGNG